MECDFKVQLHNYWLEFPVENFSLFSAILLRFYQNTNKILHFSQLCIYSSQLIMRVKDNCHSFKHHAALGKSGMSGEGVCHNDQQVEVQVWEISQFILQLLFHSTEARNESFCQLLSFLFYSICKTRCISPISSYTQQNITTNVKKVGI